MKGTRLYLDVIRDMLSMGACDEDSMIRQLGLAPSEFERFRSYLLRAGLAASITVGDSSCILQPTPRGERLLRLLEKLEAPDGPRADTGNYVDEAPAVPPRPASAGKGSLLRQRLLQIYVMQQAEVARLEAQLRDGEDEGGTGASEMKMRQRRLRTIGELLAAYQSQNS